MRRNGNIQIAVIGSSEPRPEAIAVAEEVGGVIAGLGAVLICGGLGGTMEAAARGAKGKGGLTIGILPTYDKESANRFIDIVIPTGLGHARNVVVAACGDAVVALPGEHGTRSEVAIALKLGKPVFGIGAWGAVPGVQELGTAEELQRELTSLFKDKRP